MGSHREFVEKAFAEVGRTILWRGSGIDERGHDGKTNKVLVEIDPRYFRPTEADFLVGDASKAHQKLDASINAARKPIELSVSPFDPL